MGDKRGRGSIEPAEAESVRARLRWLLVHQFETNNAALGRALGGLTGQAITQVLSTKNAPGWPVVRGLARYLGLKIDDVLAPFTPPSVERKALAKSGEPTEGQAQDMGDLVLLPSATVHARYPKLESAIAYYAYDRPARWSKLTVTAARDGHFDDAGCGSWSPPEWTSELDRLDEVLRARPRSPKLLGPKRPETPSDAPPKPTKNRRIR